jgi:hypothetical protein
MQATIKLKYLQKSRRKCRKLSHVMSLIHVRCWLQYKGIYTSILLRSIEECSRTNGGIEGYDVVEDGLLRDNGVVVLGGGW